MVQSKGELAVVGRVLKWATSNTATGRFEAGLKSLAMLCELVSSKGTRKSKEEWENISVPLICAN